jgi:hypothetical protein
LLLLRLTVCHLFVVAETLQVITECMDGLTHEQ